MLPPLLEIKKKAKNKTEMSPFSQTQAFPAFMLFVTHPNLGTDECGILGHNSDKH